jgi:hypothetical protein
MPEETVGTWVRIKPFHCHLLGLFRKILSQKHRRPVQKDCSMYSYFIRFVRKKYMSPVRTLNMFFSRTDRFSYTESHRVYSSVSNLFKLLSICRFLSDRTCFGFFCLKGHTQVLARYQGRSPWGRCSLFVGASYNPLNSQTSRFLYQCTHRLRCTFMCFPDTLPFYMS